MAQRTRFLVTYDICDPRRLRRVHTVMLAFGEALQYSVFICDLTAPELFYLKADLLDAMNTREDAVAIFDLGPPAGRAKSCVAFLGTKRQMPQDETPIW